jgi:hypothetical protein
MAKCVRKDKEVRRVSDEKAAALVKQGWQYCSKSEYRRYLDRGQEKGNVGARSKKA